MSDDRTRRDEMREQCEAFHAKHPEVWRLFVRYAFQKIKQGFEHYGGQAIIERIRFDSPLGADGKTQFKYNNNYVAYYARRFHARYPEHDGFIRTRKQTSKDEPATGLPELTPDDYA